MNNKKHVSLMMILGILTALSVSASPMVPGKNAVPYALKNVFKIQNPNPTTEVDFELSNSLIQNIANQILTLDRQVEWVTPRFDPQLSSVKDERIVYDLSAGLKNTLWSSATKTTASTHVDLKTDRTSWQTGLNIQATATLNTDTLSFLQYASEIAYKNIRHHDPFYKDQINGNLKQGMFVRSLPDLFDLLKDSQKLTVDYLSHQVRADEDQLSCIYDLTCGNPVVDQWGNRTYSETEALATQFSRTRWLKMRATYESLVLSMSPDQTAITIYSPSAQGLFRGYGRQPEAKVATVIITTSSIQLETRFFMPVLISDLNLRHRTMTSDLISLQNNDPTIQEHLDREFRNVLEDFKKILNGQIKTSVGQSDSRPLPNPNPVSQH